MAVLSPFLTLYYQSLGLSGTQIGLLAGLVPLTGMLSGTLWSATADATRRYRAILLTGIAGSWVATFFVSRATGLAGLLPLVLINAFFAAPIGALIDSSVVAQLDENRADYGRIRLWGSVGWGLSALLVGPVLERGGLGWAFTINLALLAVVFLIALRVPLAQTQPAPGSTFRGSLRVLLADTRYLTLLFTALIYGMSLSMALSYLFLHMRTMGAGESLMAVTLTGPPSAKCRSSLWPGGCCGASASAGSWPCRWRSWPRAPSPTPGSPPRAGLSSSTSSTAQPTPCSGPPAWPNRTASPRPGWGPRPRARSPAPCSASVPPWAI
jgi:MFS family permease